MIYRLYFLPVAIIRRFLPLVRLFWPTDWVFTNKFYEHLLRVESTGFFGISGRTRKNTIIVGVAVALVVTITGRIIYHT